MILNNYWNLIAGMAGLTFAWANSTENLTNISLRDTSGVTLMVNPETTDQGGSSADVVANWNPRAKLSAIVGDSSQAPTASDCALGHDITNNFSSYNVDVSTSANNNGLSTVITITGLNNTAVALTIAEIGVIKVITTTESGNYSHVTKDCLLVKHILDTPKTVQSGEWFDLTFKWTEQ